jgi:hypothetical protein
VHDGAPVADELPDQAIVHRGRQELRGLELLDQRERLSLPAGARLVVGREGEEMMKPAKIAKPPASTPNTPDARSPSLN